MSDYKLRIDAHALFQLGEQLISDDEQALLELIKNSYDADSPSVTVRIDAGYVPVEGDPVRPDQLGLIEIEDEGSGMGEEMIKKSWLMVSLSFKRDLKRLRKPSPKYNRFPLGDKGLGRLGTMRLGKTLSVETRNAQTEPGRRVTFHWTDCQSGRPLDEVPIHTTTVPPNGRTGTIVRIYALNDVAGWRSGSRRLRMTTKLTSLLSPFESFRNFQIKCLINEHDIDLGRISSKLRDTATVNISYEWNGSRLQTTTRIKLSWFQKKTKGFNEFIAKDGGKAFFEKLQQKKRSAFYQVTLSTEPGWFLEFHDDKTLEQLDLREQTGPADPGPFRGAIDYYDLERGNELGKELKDFAGPESNYRELIKELAQVYIYRDNFGIRMEHDWLQLGKAWTSGAGYYSLRPGSSIGYFQISVADNPLLIEKSDREGFIENSASLGFYKLAETIQKFVNKGLNFLGKESVAFLQEKTGYHADEKNSSPAAFDKTVGELEQLIASGQKFADTFKTSVQARQLAFRKAEAAVNVLSFDNKLAEPVKAKVRNVLAVLNALEKELRQEQMATKSLTDELLKQRDLTGMIRKRVDEFAERAEAFNEMVATGLSAQAAVHDAPGLLQQIDGAAMLFNRDGRRGYVDPKDAIKHSDTILAANASVKQMLALLEPMLRGRRVARRTAKLSELVNEYFELRGPRLKLNGILHEVRFDVGSDFSVTINPGRLIQVLDNLVSNSEYWLVDHFGKGSKEGRIVVEINKPELTFFDNGPGIHPHVEPALFELFVSGKPNGKGNGLGLFITRQLLERENCSIYVDEERNRNDRRFKFHINLNDVRSDKS